MKVSDVCKETGLTKKAIAYYQEKRLICPRVDENGYRDFTDAHVRQLKQIAFLRKLDLGTDAIESLLASTNRAQAGQQIKQSMFHQLQAKEKQVELLQRWIDREDLDVLEKECRQFEQYMTVQEKLLKAFPGYYGRFISVHFGRFLNDPIETQEQQQAYEQIICFLDGVEFPDLPEQCKAYLDEWYANIPDETLTQISEQQQRAIQDFETFFEENEQVLREYEALKKSDAFCNSAMGELMQIMRQFGETSGYNDVFIPLMRKLSPSYEAYYQELLKANELFLQKMPQAKQF